MMSDKNDEDEQSRQEYKPAKDNEQEKPSFSLVGLFGRNKHKKQTSTEDEIRDMVSVNNELLDDEKRMIHEIIDLGDMTVREVMQPRVDMIFAEDTEDVRTVVDRMRGTGYSRLPVFHEDIDCIVGTVYFKDLVFPLIDGKGADPVSKYTTEALFVPETKDMFPLLSEMQASHRQMAIVVDEYGGTDGLITLEDIVEEIVGEIVDETDRAASRDISDFMQLGDGEWLVDGRFSVEDACALGWPVCESDNYETIAGWLLDMINEVPQLGDIYEKDGYTFTVERMRRHRISKIRVRIQVENATKSNIVDST